MATAGKGRQSPKGPPGDPGFLPRPEGHGLQGQGVAGRKAVVADPGRSQRDQRRGARGTRLIVSAIIFWAIELLPGDIATEVLGQSATPETLAAFRERFGLNDPAPVRYINWLGGALTGDLGLSMANQRPISQLLGDRAFNTFFLAGYAALIAIPLAVGLGIVAALYRGSWLTASSPPRRWR